VVLGEVKDTEVAVLDWGILHQQAQAKVMMVAPLVEMVVAAEVVAHLLRGPSQVALLAQQEEMEQRQVSPDLL
jgi:hypothetical protein